MPGWLGMLAGPRSCGRPCPFWTEARPAGMRRMGARRDSPAGADAAGALVGARRRSAARRRGGGGPWPRWTESAAGYGLDGVQPAGWAREGRRTPGGGARRENIARRRDFERLQRDGRLSARAWLAKGPPVLAAGTPTPAGRRLSRSASFFKATDTPQYRLASTVAGIVIGVRWGLRQPAAADGTRDRQRILYRRRSMSPGWPGPCSSAGRGSPPRRALVMRRIRSARLRAAAAEPLR